MQDRFVKIMLVLVAGLLAANIFQSQNSPSIIGSAQAQGSGSTQVQTSKTPVPANNYKVRTLGGFPVAEDLQDVVALGDGSSFVVSNSKGFMVYQVVPSP